MQVSDLPPILDSVGHISFLVSCSDIYICCIIAELLHFVILVETISRKVSRLIEV